MIRNPQMASAAPRRDPATRQKQRGSIVLVALSLTTVLAISVVGFFAVCMRTMELSNRSFLYTSSTILAENGMEEALWSLNQALNSSTYTWSGWTLATVNGVPTATKTLSGFTTNAGLQGSVNIKVQYYSTTTPYTQPPIITCDGITQANDGTQIDKQLKAIVKPAALFSNAIGSTDPPGSSRPSGSYYNQSHVSFYSDSSVLVDSYDSTQNSGNYTASPSTTNRSDQAIVSGPWLSLSNANILGYAASANSSGTLATFTSGTLKGFTTPTGTSVDSSRESNNANQNLIDIVTPSAAGSILPTSGSIGPGYYYYTGGSYYQPSGNTLTITGPATIYIQYGCDIEGTVNISSSSTGPVQFYIGDYFELWDGTINNQTKSPAKLGIFCNSQTSYSLFYTNSDFYGVIYSPYNDIYLYSWGGTQKIYGSVVAEHVISYYSNFQLHYDLNLRKTTFSMVNTPYEVTEWIEN